jgi:uncharacterized protein (DUF1330 family)
VPALWIGHVEVTDAEGYAEYVAKAAQVIPAHGGTFIARGGRYHQMEGKEHPRNVVIEFATFEDAIACYRSEEYQAITAQAQACSNRSVVIVETTE